MSEENSIEKENSGNESLQDRMQKVESLAELKELCLDPENIGDMIPEDVELMQPENRPKPSREDIERGNTGKDILDLGEDALNEYIDKFRDPVLRETMRRLTKEEREK